MVQRRTWRRRLTPVALGICASLLAVVGKAREPDTTPAEIRPAVDRGLAFLVKDALAWKQEHQCASCHHAALVIWAMHEAKQRGHAVDEPALAEWTQWIAESGDGKTGVPRPEGIPKALNAKAVWFALGLGAQVEPDAGSRAGQQRLLKTVEEDQTEDGNWLAWPETRAPIFGASDESMTALALLSLVPLANADDAPAKATLERGVQWLAKTPTDDDPQSIAMRLVLWTRLGRNRDEWQPLVQRIKDRQNADGGWSQAAEMQSDAWATGQALYALAHAECGADDPAIARGRAFLISTQREDGSWAMTSRPTKPGGDGSMSLIPITGAGSAWAVLGLVRGGGESPRP